MREMSRQVGYEALNTSNNKIIPGDEMDCEDNQKLVIFDDYVSEKNQKDLINYFIEGRHKNCSVIYLSQSFYKTPRDVRLNCSHYCIYEFPSSRERNMISAELDVSKENSRLQLKSHFHFCMLINQ